MSIKVGILQTGDTREALRGNFANYDDMFRHMFEDFNFELTTYRVLDNEFPKSIEAEQAYIITGSKFGVYEDIEWIKPLEEFIRSCYSAEIPLVGICFGHQILAQALGGAVEKFQGGWAIGMQEYEYYQNKENIDLLAFHQDQVIKKPEDAKVFMSSNFCQYAGLQYENKAISVQPHPEFKNDFVEALTLILADNFSEEMITGTLKKLKERSPSNEMTTMLGNFIVNNVI